MSRLDRVHALRRMPPKCTLRASFGRGRCIWAEHGGVAEESPMLAERLQPRRPAAADSLRGCGRDRRRVRPFASRCIALPSLIAGLSRRRSRVRVPSLPYHALQGFRGGGRASSSPARPRMSARCQRSAAPGILIAARGGAARLLRDILITVDVSPRRETWSCPVARTAIAVALRASATASPDVMVAGSRE
jgi:hypothetical protein